MSELAKTGVYLLAGALLFYAFATRVDTTVRHTRDEHTQPGCVPMTLVLVAVAVLVGIGVWL